MMRTQTTAISRALVIRALPQVTTQYHHLKSKLNNNFPPLITHRIVQTANLSNECSMSKSHSRFHLAHAISSNSSLLPQVGQITSRGAVQLTRCLIRVKRSRESLKTMTRRPGYLLEAPITCILESSNPNLCAPIKSFLAGLQQTQRDQQ